MPRRRSPLPVPRQRPFDGAEPARPPRARPHLRASRPMALAVPRACRSTACTSCRCRMGTDRCDPAFVSSHCSMKHRRTRIFAVACTTSTRVDLPRAGRAARRPISIPALIPAFCRAGAGFSETSSAPIASTGAGLRGAVGCRDTHLGLLDHQEHDQNPSSTSSAARNSARAFCSVSAHSFSGTESATTPAAACT